VILALLAAACGRKAASPAGVGTIGEAARLLYSALEADDFERIRILLATPEDATELDPRLRPLAEIDFGPCLDVASGSGWFDWGTAVYPGYVLEDDGGPLGVLLVYVEGNDRGSRHFHDIRFGVARVARGWVLAGPFYCAGCVYDLPPLER